MTESQTLLQIHLLELGIKTEAEVQFMPDRKFRFDLANDEHKLGFDGLAANRELPNSCGSDSATSRTMSNLFSDLERFCSIVHRNRESRR